MGGVDAARTAADGSSRSVEIERTYDVDADTVLPDWTVLPRVVRVGAAEPRALDARYLDTADLALARERVALRRRSGGPDAGWHVKISAADGRHEWHWPLDAEPDDDADASISVPDAVADAVAPWAAPPFTPLARIRNDRVAYALLDRNGRPLAEVVDDHVSARAERTGVQTVWREWEVELMDAAPTDPAEIDAFFAAVDDAVASAGGRVAASDSKLGRALGR